MESWKQLEKGKPQKNGGRKGKMEKDKKCK